MSKNTEIIKNLDLIESAWRNYFFSSNFLLSKINYDKIENSNYVGVIFGNFHDTLPLLKPKKIEGDEDSFFYSVGLLQIIYVQQDLVRELYQVFNIKQRNGRNKNRQIRNELIGHPISREGEFKELKSFTLFSYTTNNSTLSYLKYSKKNDFKFESINYNFRDILDSHFQFLDFRFGGILEKIKEFFAEYVSILEEMLLGIDKVDFEDLIIDIEKYLNDFFNEDLVFKKVNILKCYELKDSHPRFRYNINCFKNNLICFLKGKINNINVDFLDKKADYEDEDIIINRIDLMDKLYENHRIFGIDYFKKTYSSNREAIIELDNMQKNINNELEYYSSYNYLKHLLSKKD